MTHIGASALPPIYRNHCKRPSVSLDVTRRYRARAHDLIKVVKAYDQVGIGKPFEIDGVHSVQILESKKEGNIEKILTHSILKKHGLTFKQFQRNEIEKLSENAFSVTSWLPKGDDLKQLQRQFPYKQRTMLNSMVSRMKIQEINQSTDVSLNIEINHKIPWPVAPLVKPGICKGLEAALDVFDHCQQTNVGEQVIQGIQMVQNHLKKWV